MIGIVLLASIGCGGSSSPAPETVTPEAPDVPVPLPSKSEAPPPPPSVGDSPAEADRAALMQAAQTFARQHVATGVEFDLELKAQDGTFALLYVLPKSQEADTALLFMQKAGGAWKGLDLGTGIDCADYAALGMQQSLCDQAGL